MSIRQKALLIIAVILAASAAALYETATAIMNQNRSAIEQQETRSSIARTKAAFMFELDRLHAYACDYAIRDDTCAFLDAPGPHDNRSSPGRKTFANAQLNFIIVADVRGNIVFSRGFDPAADTSIPVTRALLDHIRAGGLLCAEAGAGRRGVLAAHGCMALIAACPVLKSAAPGPPAGTLILGRWIDDRLTGQLRRLTNLTLSFHPAGSARRWPHFAEVESQLQSDSAIAVQHRDGSTLYGFSRISDLYGQPALYLKVELPRPLVRHGNIGRMYMAGTIGAIGLLFGLIVYLGFHKLVTSRGALRESEQRFRSIAESTPDAVLLTDSDGLIIFWNRGAEKTFGYAVQEVLGKPSFLLLAEKHRQQEESRLHALRGQATMPTSGRIIELDCIKKNGAAFPAEATFSVWRREGKTFISTILRDISERRRSEEERTLLTTAVEQSDELIVITDSDAAIRYVNPSFEQATGYRRSEVLGKKPSILKSGRQSDAFYRELWRTITSGHVWRGYFVNRRKSGTLYNEEAVITPLRDALGTIRHYVAVKRDVTQKQHLEQQVRQSQKMEAIGTLAGGIAHDFNNILTAIIGFSELSLSPAGADPKLAYNLKNIVDAAFRAKSLVDQILTFSRHTEQEMKPMSLAPLVKETVKFLRASLPSTIEIRLHATASNDIVQGDPTQLHQVLMNLCTNAAHAMKAGGGVLTIALERESLSKDAASRRGLPAGDYLRLSVADTGHGIRADILDKIFEPYFTTKAVGEGTGLGLAVAHGIVQSCNGAITLQSDPDRGTTFDVFLPALEAAAALEKIAAEPVSGGTERILLVDDEDWVCDAGGKMLESMGYRVTTRTVPEQALELFRSAPDSFDLLIADKTMPHMTGFDLAVSVRKIRGDMAIVLCSGYLEKHDGTLAKTAGIREIIKKPFTRRQLADAIRRALAESTFSKEHGRI